MKKNKIVLIIMLMSGFTVRAAMEAENEAVEHKMSVGKTGRQGKEPVDAQDPSIGQKFYEWDKIYVPSEGELDPFEYATKECKSQINKLEDLEFRDKELDELMHEMNSLDPADKDAQQKLSELFERFEKLKEMARHESD